MREFFGVLALLIALAAGCLYVLWAIRDAHRRNKNALFVVIAVVFFFPFGLLAWLLFRPDVRLVR